MRWPESSRQQVEEEGQRWRVVASKMREERIRERRKKRKKKKETRRKNQEKSFTCGGR